MLLRRACSAVESRYLGGWSRFLWIALDAGLKARTTRTSGSMEFFSSLLSRRLGVKRCHSDRPPTNLWWRKRASRPRPTQMAGKSRPGLGRSGAARNTFVAYWNQYPRSSSRIPHGAADKFAAGHRSRLRRVIRLMIRCEAIHIVGALPSTLRETHQAGKGRSAALG